MGTPVQPATGQLYGKTRQTITLVRSLTSQASGDLLHFEIPKVGALARLWATVRGTITTVGAANALGQASIINRVRVYGNTVSDIFNVSGPGYFHLLAPNIDLPTQALNNSTALTAVAAGAVNLDMVIPVTLNLQNLIGAVPIGNQETLVSVDFQMETDGNIGVTAWTARPTVTLFMEMFTTPPGMEDSPIFRTMHTIIEEKMSVSIAGEVRYRWPIANVYLQTLHGLGFAVTGGTDNWTSMEVIANYTDHIYYFNPGLADLRFSFLRHLTRAPGIIPIDLASSAGLGLYGSMRDALDSDDVSVVESVIQAAGAGTLYTIRRQLVPLA